MRATKSTPWIIGAVVIGVAALALVWLFAISPQLAAASEAREEADEVIESNVLLETRIAQLAADFAKIEDLRAELAQLRTGMPVGLDQAAFNKEVEALGAESGVFVEEVTFSNAMPFASGAAAPSDPDSIEVPANLYSVAVNLTFVGSPDANNAYIAGMQERTSRHFLLAGLSIEGVDPETLPGGFEILDGFERVQVSGLIYIFTEDVPAADGSVAAGDQPSDEGTEGS